MPNQKQCPNTMEYMHLKAKTMLWIHGIAAVLFVALWIVATIFGWVKSSEFISHVSMVALVYAAFTGWQGARAESEAENDR